MDGPISFDWGYNFVGVMDIRTKKYTPYFGENLVDGILRIFNCKSSIVSFNGTYKDLPELKKILDRSGIAIPAIKNHCDMSKISSILSWPPNRDTKPIVGSNLNDTFRRFFPHTSLHPSTLLELDVDVLANFRRQNKEEARSYLEDNWQDCYRPAVMWESWPEDMITDTLISNGWSQNEAFALINDVQ